MTFDPVEGHLLLAWPDADVAWTIDRIQRGMLGGISVAVIVVVVARWVAAYTRRAAVRCCRA